LSWIAWLYTQSHVLRQQALGALLRPGIYTAYMLLSKRVKATFVVRLGERAPRRAPAADVAM
jgi:hypothetical protein